MKGQAGFWDPLLRPPADVTLRSPHIFSTEGKGSPHFMSNLLGVWSAQQSMGQSGVRGTRVLTEKLFIYITSSK